MRKSFTMAIAVIAWAVMLAEMAQAQAPKPVQFEVQLARAMPNDTPLTVYADWRDGFTAGFALARSYNKAVHDVDLAGLTYDTQRQTMRGVVKVTINPDDYQPADRRPVTWRYELDLKVNDGLVGGSYDGACGAAARKGTIEGRVLAVAPDDGTYRLLFLHGMARLNQLAGMNKGYALDMRLRFHLDQGKASGAIFESMVPDYRSYCAVVESVETSFRGAALKATVVAVLDYGSGQRALKEKPSFPRFEKNTYVLTGFRIGDKVAGRYTDTAGTMTATDFFSGEVDRQPPPAPAGAKAFLRLHGAMRGECPIILHLGLAGEGHIHGFAWASAYNHQPHAVDASKLKLEGNRLTGEVVVTIWPDCYKPIEDIVVRHMVDVTFDKGIASGTFKGKDNNDSFEGIVTGELNRRKPPAVTAKTLGACELTLHSGTGKGGHAAMNLTFRDGKAETLKVRYPQWTDPYDARLDTCDLRVEGDRLSGTVVVMVKGKDGRDARFSYRMDAMLDGDALTGFWHGMAEGKHILNKSSKLYGKVLPMSDVGP